MTAAAASTAQTSSASTPTGKWLEWDGWLDEAAYHNNQSGGAVLTPATIEDHYRLATTGT